MDMKSVSERLQVIRSEKNIKSVRAFALQLNADPSFFDKMYKGSIDITDNILGELQEKFNVNPAWLKYGEAPKYFGVANGHRNANGPNNVGPPGDELIRSKDETISALREHIEFLKSENDRLAKQLSSSLTDLREYGQVNRARLKAVLECQKHLRAKADNIPLKKASEIVDMLYASSLHEDLQKDI